MVPHTGSGGGTRGGEVPLARSRMDEDAANREILPGGIGRWRWCGSVESMVPTSGTDGAPHWKEKVRASGSDGAP